MLPKAFLLGRNRNKVKFSKWGFYIKDCEQSEENPIKRLRAAAIVYKARVPGKPNQCVVCKKVSKNKVEVDWPHAVSADTCTRFLKQALGNNWRKSVTDPAGVKGSEQEAGTDEEGVVAAEAAGEESLEELESRLSAEAPVSRGASSLAAGPFSPRPPCSGATVASSAATAEARSGVNLLALKLEAITLVYGSKERGRFEDLQPRRSLDLGQTPGARSQPRALGRGGVELLAGVFGVSVGDEGDSDAWQTVMPSRRSWGLQAKWLGCQPSQPRGWMSCLSLRSGTGSRARLG